ncbi:MAG: 16S rRNA (adenine(1518)-N(6)/adenine(1519)-N(6))-dimethyltransferase RsmA [Planctomycetota bacterium]|jgi:16S rRNA (adenine1518-N6/adenine1519-N6)-dimethyltransferase
MQTLSEIRALLAERGLRPKHRLGQNFLHDKNQIRRLVEAAGVGPGDQVLEVGPGTGALTEALLDRGCSIVCCELDRDLAGILRDRLADRITLIVGDCLERGRALNADIARALGDRTFVLVANLPYQVASPLMTCLLLDHPTCAGQYVTIQKEVADRLTAPPGGREYGPLGIIIRAQADVHRIGTVSPSCFWPAPKVTSAMVAITPKPSPGLDNAHAFARFITTLFSKRRKQLGTIFGRDADWPDGVTPDLRPQALAIEQLIELWRGQRAED